MTRTTGPHPANRRPAATRAGFTLIELMVVIVIIGIIAAMIIPAVYNAIEQARTTEVTSEINRMETAVAKFENRYGVQPPSGIILVETGALWDVNWDASPPAAGLTELHRATSRGFIRRAWPQFDYTYSAFPGNAIDLNGDGDTNDVLFLNGAECLVFFLGGTQPFDTDDDGVFDAWRADGFAANNRNPFMPARPHATNTMIPYQESRITPFHDFVNGRFVDIDLDGMPEYLDTIPGQTTPMLYFSGYGGRGYKPYGVDLTFNTNDDEILPLAFGRGPYAVYLQTDGNKSDGTMPPDGTPWKPQSYQILSPGRDGDYGYGGEYTIDFDLTDASNPDPNNPGMSVTRAPDYLQAERDNITNFRNARLGN